MGFPQTISGLKNAGYKFEGESECKSCGADIEWWTTPRGKKLPTDHGTARPHWETCPEADSHRSSGDSRDSAPAPTSKVTSATLDMDWLKEKAKGCYCVVCRKLTGKSQEQEQKSKDEEPF